MVLRSNYTFLKKKCWFLKFFFFLWKKKCWSGGRSFGKKVFRGQVGKVSGRWFSYLIIWNYSILNVQGLVQAFFKPFKVNFIVNFVFFWKYGLLAILPAEESSKLSEFYINSFKNDEVAFGSSNIIKNFIVGSLFFLLQTKKNKNASVARASGTFCKFLKKINDWAFIQFPSKVVGIIPITNFVTKGISKKILIKKLFKAGDSWFLGCIPKVRGIAMNPVDHPHGGWTNGGIHPWTPTGFLTKNVKTRKKKHWSNPIIFSLRK